MTSEFGFWFYGAWGGAERGQWGLILIVSCRKYEEVCPLMWKNSVISQIIHTQETRYVVHFFFFNYKITKIFLIIQVIKYFILGENIFLDFNIQV